MDIFTLFVVALAAFIVLCVIGLIFSITHGQDDAPENYDPPASAPFPTFSFKELHEMNEKSRHRNDAKHERHKRNQTPW